MIQFNQLAIRRGTSLLFSDATFNIHAGQKVGINGANGCGKSSLFALLLGSITADSGSMTFPQQWQLAHVSQQPPRDERAAIEFVLDGDTEYRQLEQAMQQAESCNDGIALARLHDRFEHIGGYLANSRAARLLDGLGFSHEAQYQAVNAFSGGWRMRLNLARALMCRSDLLLLDEPTNHLDLDAVIWLEDWLSQYTGTLLLISHDRDFLDRICSHIVHIEQQKMTLYTGNYSQFEKTRAAKLANQQAAYNRQQAEIQHIQRYIDRFRAKASKARQAQSRIKALERMQAIAPAHVDSPFRFHFSAAEKLPNPLLKLEQVSMGYPGKAVLREVSLAISPGDRIGLLGPNGAGKSTLIKSLAGSLAVIEGHQHSAQDLQVGYFAQHQVEQLHPQHSPLQHLQQLAPGASEQELRNYLGSYGFSSDKATAVTAPFSGGEKARLALALIIYTRPNLLLLDEPTNHLDLEMRQALASALQDFDGAIVMVSHDRYLLRVSCDQLWMVMHGCVTNFSESLEDYPRWLSQQQISGNLQSRPNTSDDANSAAARRDRKRQQAEQRKLRQPLLKKLQAAETELEKLNRQREHLHQQLSDNALYESDDPARLQSLLQQDRDLEQAIETVETHWLEASEALEHFDNEMA